MPYTIHFVGLNCFVRQNDNSYVVAMPDGRNARDPRFPDPRPLPPHLPFLIAVANEIDTDNWMAEIEDGLAFLPIDDGAVITFQFADIPGTIDDSDYRRKIYTWSDLDPDFDIGNKRQPHGAIATALLRQGTFRVFRVREADALLSQVEIQVPFNHTSVQIVSTANGVVRSVKIPNGAEIIIANVSEDDTGTLEDFFIYYVLNTGGQAPSGRSPEVRSGIPFSPSLHPYFLRSRNLHVSCSPTNLP